MNAGNGLAVATGVLCSTLAGYGYGGPAGAVLGGLLGSLLLAGRWKRQPLWSWAWLCLIRNRPIALRDPISATNDRTAAGVRYQDGVAVTAIQLLGQRHPSTVLHGAASADTSNSLDVTSLFGEMTQSLDLNIESLSIISAGSRHHGVGDYPRVYDTLIGTPPYAGRRETWLVVRIGALGNAEALRWRHSAGAAAVAATQRLAAGLRNRGIRARIATAADISALDRRLGSACLQSSNRQWRAVHDTTGWSSTYTYRCGDITSEILAQAWTLRADRIVQNITLFPDRTGCASITVRTPQPASAPPRVGLDSAAGQQARAIGNNLVAPFASLRGQCRGPLEDDLRVPIGASGVLFGRLADGGRLLLPVVDPSDSSHVRLSARDAIVKRILIRAAATGERLTVHSTDTARWASVRMPNVLITSDSRPVPGTTISVLDGTTGAGPRPATTMFVGDPGLFRPQDDTADADVLIEQIGPASIRVSTARAQYDVAVDLFRVENRYAPDELDVAAVSSPGAGPVSSAGAGG